MTSHLTIVISFNIFSSQLVRLRGKHFYERFRELQTLNLRFSPNYTPVATTGFWRFLPLSLSKYMAILLSPRIIHRGILLYKQHIVQCRNPNCWSGKPSSDCPRSQSMTQLKLAPLKTCNNCFSLTQLMGTDCPRSQSMTQLNFFIFNTTDGQDSCYSSGYKLRLVQASETGASWVWNLSCSSTDTKPRLSPVSTFSVFHCWGAGATLFSEALFSEAFSSFPVLGSQMWQLQLIYAQLDKNRVCRWYFLGMMPRQLHMNKITSICCIWQTNVWNCLCPEPKVVSLFPHVHSLLNLFTLFVTLCQFTLFETLLLGPEPATTVAAKAVGPCVTACPLFARFACWSSLVILFTPFATLSLSTRFETLLLGPKFTAAIAAEAVGPCVTALSEWTL